jgi:hypothetical protein
MTSDLLPLKILSSTVGVGILTDGWNLAEPYEDGDDARCFTTEVTFASPFSAPPVVHLGLSGFDVDQHTSARITLKAEAISETGFLVRVSTWRASRVYSAEFNWLAIGS